MAIEPPGRIGGDEVTTIMYVLQNGGEVTCDVPEGSSVMEGAVANSIPGIEAECGGSCSCATCHVHVHEDWLEKTGPAGETEREMLEFADSVAPNSRLGCQIKITDALDGLIVTVVEP